MEYDRNSASRTQVFDDQSDFFEVDANAWLTREVCTQRQPAGCQCMYHCNSVGVPNLRPAQEREALKQHERAAAEAEDARRRRVTVTVDLLGRQVRLYAAHQTSQ